MKFSGRFLNRFQLHLVFWVLCVILYVGVYVSSGPNIDFRDLFGSTAEFVITSSIITYLNLVFFIPALFYRSRYLLYAVAITATVLTYTLLVSLFEIYVLKLYGPTISSVFFGHLYVSNFVFVILFVVVTTGLKLSRKWFTDRETMHRLKLEKAETELQLLRNQVNPHFLFNTLNNLYSLILCNENEKAGEMVLKLSGIMEYMIHDSKTDLVDLKTEITQLRNYLDLEKIRLTETDEIEFTCTTDKESYKIAPYVLLPFVENGFKHGIGDTIHNGFIKIHLKAEKGILQFSVDNSKPGNGKIPSDKKGFGLSNIRRRLDILYPDGHELEIINHPLSHHINLKIELHDNFVSHRR